MRHKFTGIYRDSAGNVVTSGTVSVYLAGTTTVASIYTASSGGAAVNSVTSSSTDGSFTFYVDRYAYNVGQKFKIVLSKSGLTSATYDNVNLYDVVSAMIDSDLTISIPTDFSTINSALDHLQYCWIPEDITVTISILAGTYTYANRVYFYHPCGRQIKLSGATPVLTTITSVGAVTGSTGAWSVPITVTSSSGISANQYAILSDVTGTGDYYSINGVWKISNVTGNIITVTNTNQQATFPTFTVTGGNVIVPQTILHFTSSAGILAQNVPVCEISNIIVQRDSGGTTYGGITATGSGADITIGNYVGISGFGYGLHTLYGSHIGGESVYTSNSSIGGAYVQYGSSVTFDTRFISTGSAGSGLYVNTGASFMAYAGGIFSGNGSVGLYAGNGSVYTIGTVVSSNKADGIRAVNGGRIKFTSGISSYNTDYGVVAEGSGSVIHFDGGSATYNGKSGVFAALNGCVYGTTISSTYNTEYGIHATQGGIIQGTITSANNTSYGLLAEHSGIVIAPLFTSNTDSVGAYATLGGYINGSGGDVTSSVNSSFIATYNGFINAINTTSASPGAYDYYSMTGGIIIRVGIDGTTNINGTPEFIDQNTPTTKTTSTTLTIEELMKRIITGTHSAGSTQTYTLPTGTLSDTNTYIGINSSFDWNLINLSSGSSNTITLSAGATHSIVGAVVVDAGSSAVFRTRKTATNTFITYRIA